MNKRELTILAVGIVAGNVRMAIGFAISAFVYYAFGGV